MNNTHALAVCLPHKDVMYLYFSIDKSVKDIMPIIDWLLRIQMSVSHLLLTEWTKIKQMCHPWSGLQNRAKIFETCIPT